MPLAPIPRPRRSAGFTLMEVIVAVVIGLLAVIMMMQLLALFEGNKRGTTGGADAQNSGVIGLYGVQRDIRQSGYGIGTPSLFACNMTLPSGGTVPVVPALINPAAAIIPTGDANTDTLLVISGNANGNAQGNLITARSGQEFTVQSPASFAVGDAVIAVPALNPCAANLVLGGVSAVAATTVTATTAAIDAGTMYDLGPVPSVRAYAVRNGNLTVCNYMTTNCGLAQNAVSASAWAAAWVPVATDVVALRAQYGSDTGVSMDGAVDAFNQTTPATACDWVRVGAIRLAVVARNSQYNKTNADGTEVTASAPVWDGSADAPINLTADAEWQHYRYRVFQTVVPLRNLVWLGNLVREGLLTC